MASKIYRPQFAGTLLDRLDHRAGETFPIRKEMTLEELVEKLLPELRARPDQVLMFVAGDAPPDQPLLDEVLVFSVSYAKRPEAN